MRIAVEVSGDRDAERTLRDMASRGRHTQPAFARMLGDLEDVERKFFDGHGEGRWPAMSPKTKKRHGEHPLLDLTGALMRSLVDSHSLFAVREARDGEARFGTRDPVAHLQAEGHKAPKRAVLAPITRSRSSLAEILRKQLLGSA